MPLLLLLLLLFYNADGGDNNDDDSSNGGGDHSDVELFCALGMILDRDITLLVIINSFLNGVFLYFFVKILHSSTPIDC